MDELDEKMRALHILRAMQKYALRDVDRAALAEGIDALKKEIERLKDELAKADNGLLRTALPAERQ